MQPDDWLCPIVQGSFVPWMRNIRIVVALPKIHGAGAERIGGAAMHANPALQLNHCFLEVRPALDHFLGRIPVRPFLLALDRRLPRPDEPFASDPDAITGRPAAILDMVEIVIGGIDHDRARRFLGRVGDILAQKGRIDLRQFDAGDGEARVLHLRIDRAVRRLDVQSPWWRSAGNGGGEAGTAAASIAGWRTELAHPARLAAAEAEAPAIILRRVRVNIVGQYPAEASS